MKKRVLALLLALACLLLFPAAVQAAEEEPELPIPPRVSELKIHGEAGEAWLEIRLKAPASVRDSIRVLKSFGKTEHYLGFELSVSLEGGAWELVPIRQVEEGDLWDSIYRTEAVPGLGPDTWVQARARFFGKDDENLIYSDWSSSVSVNEKPAGGQDSEEAAEGEESLQSSDFTAHDWAKPELTEADGLGLIPTDLRTADLMQPITRAEFAAVSVKVYEALSGLQAEPAAENPFTDTSDPEVLKALHVGITNGLSATEFGPDALLNREQAATMLSRVYKKVAFDGWTLGTDGDFAEAFRALFTMPEAFTDDADISSWARDSVYFMAANGILKGMEGGTFQPRAVTEEQQAAGYAQATREQAILIAVRLVKNLGT